jgi:integrase
MDLNTFTHSLWPTLAITKKTRQNYEGAYRCNIAATLGNKQLTSITKNELIDALATLPPQTRYQTLMALRVIYREAIERELVQVSYGEAAALTQEDVHDGFVHITKSKHGATKSQAGVRNVPLLCKFVPFAQHQNSIAKALKPYGVTVHSLRKTYAYTLKSAGIHVTTAAKLMGHSNPMMTLKIYTQVRDDEAGLATRVFKICLVII